MNWLSVGEIGVLSMTDCRLGCERLRLIDPKIKEKETQIKIK